MVDQVSWVPEGVNVDVPSSARIYDYLLGGGHNFDADRRTAEELIKVLPVRDMARRNRSYLRRVVLELSKLGMTQFLDLGSGIPTVGNVHEVAHEANPDARVVYVDFEPVAITHAELMLENEPNVTAVLGDLREPEKVLQLAEAQIDFSQPVALLIVGVLQFIPDADDPWKIIQRYADRLASGSHVALSHFTADSMPAAMAAGKEIFAKTAEPITPRTKDQVRDMLAGLEIIEPGIVFTPEWRPETPEDIGEDPRKANLYAAVGRKP
ncbi:hypothetical protein Lesp02_67770 [Lentzea sp. NBRC 105346]|uniref:SAM-dependent methyltransferase n=1 Tax=Lentzea sp. NBRC 105346 TaxID=3032205 RepID=UPI0024A45D4D|nr:SAM-dependent methyltransferase [Lentzea sp. NBRC 105346]GLZ34590.1 hypothetical protein Lesp02_67770 [Lentzea sp. NBRC 105346]